MFKKYYFNAGVLLISILLSRNEQRTPTDIMEFTAYCCQHSRHLMLPGQCGSITSHVRKPSLAISLISIEMKTNVSDISSVPILRIDVNSETLVFARTTTSTWQIARQCSGTFIS
jgi:hypothetical protein